MQTLRKTGSLVENSGSTAARKERAPALNESAIRQRLVGLLVRYYPYSLLGAAAVVVIVETLLVLLVQQQAAPVSPWLAGLVFALPAVLVLWGLFFLLQAATDQMQPHRLDSSLLAELSQKLSQARTWDEIVRQIADFTHLVCPRASTSLAVVNPISLLLEVEAACTPDGVITLKPGRVAHNTAPAGAQTPALASSRRFELPLTRNDLQVGLIQVEYAESQPPRPFENEALKHAAPLMALALEGALLQALAAEQAAESETQRQQIAQNLHDSLAQNISYLRLKLDQLTGGNAVQEIGVVLAELERMRSTADEAYQQVRSTLEELNPLQGKDLMNVITSQARAITGRANIHLNTNQIGSPLTLPPVMRQQILYIAREALHNIEKHAHASAVSIQCIWLENELIIKITDNGVGFNPLFMPQEGHYGLWIMQNRASEINGVLKILPADKQGTEVTLWVPVP
jgi:signal transduction histidine kinase